MAASDVTFTQDGENEKLHPYVVAIVRWCVSCVWSAATVLLHRLMTAPLQLPPITVSKPPSSSPRPPARPASSGHIHPEPLVQCVVLHQPEIVEMDFVFIHGLYGSLENTWRQGDWRSKYKIGPNRVPLKRSSSIPTPCICDGCTRKDRICLREDINFKTNRSCSNTDLNMFNGQDFFKGKVKVLSEDEMFITEKFYNNTLLNQVNIVDNFEMQAQFVRDLFQNNMCDDEKLICDNEKDGLQKESDTKYIENNEYLCECGDSKCEVGCGCICNKCYSPCWPKDWLQVDFPTARIISVNYTSDPYLWRPLWVKECKRLRLHERAEQMTQQLLDLGVGQKPIVWVGHSKGGLFIKQIYCEAYEAHLETTNKKPDASKNKIDAVNNPYECNECHNENGESIFIQTNSTHVETNSDSKENNTEERSLIQQEEEDLSSQYNRKLRASLWTNSSGFMFYSVPHRGSSLADIKTPITARSIELLEISKDNSLVLSLHERWLRATAAAALASSAASAPPVAPVPPPTPAPPAVPAPPVGPLVRSLVETNRTLMSVLWLRIVSAESADAGIGALCGISVDHREICKPSSRSCILYKELLNLIRASIDNSQDISFQTSTEKRLHSLDLKADIFK